MPAAYRRFQARDWTHATAETMLDPYPTETSGNFERYKYKKEKFICNKCFDIFLFITAAYGISQAGGQTRAVAAGYTTATAKLDLSHISTYVQLALIPDP